MLVSEVLRSLSDNAPCGTRCAACTPAAPRVRPCGAAFRSSSQLFTQRPLWHPLRRLHPCCTPGASLRSRRLRPCGAQLHLAARLRRLRLRPCCALLHPAAPCCTRAPWPHPAAPGCALAAPGCAHAAPGRPPRIRRHPAAPPAAPGPTWLHPDPPCCTLLHLAAPCCIRLRPCCTRLCPWAPCQH